MKIALVGSGISGLSCAYLLSKKHMVHIYESEPRLGGHANTITINVGAETQSLDTGFLVFNNLTYPNFISLLKELQVEYIDSDMSLSIQHSNSGTEWAGSSIRSIFAQTKNFFSLRFWKMLFDIRRFQNEAETLLIQATEKRWNLRDLIDSGDYSQAFVDLYLLPIGAAIWSTPEKNMLNFPAETFLNFFLNHKLLQWKDRPVWKTILNGSKAYVDAIEAVLPHVFKDDSVNTVKRLDDGSVSLISSNRQDRYDAVIFATHPPATVKILSDLSPDESSILNSFSFEKNKVTVHKENSFMPVKKICWSSWNIRASTQNDSSEKLDLTYYINKLQPWIQNEDIFVTLNSKKAVTQSLKNINYEHPMFSRTSIESQRRLPEIQGRGNIFHIGAWTRYGFHEDGVVSAMAVAKHFGVDPNWNKSND